MGKMEKTAQNELQEAVLFPKTKLCFETAFVTKFVQVALSKNQKINCPPKRGNSSLLRRRDYGIGQSGLLAAAALAEKSTYESLDQCGADPGGQPETGIEENTQIYRHVVWPHSGLLQSLLPGHQLR